MRKTPILLPKYGERFRCIGPACEDTCCRNWVVPVDEETFEKYRALPASPLRVLMDTSIVRNAAEERGGGEGNFAEVRMGAEHECPFLSEERLCRIQLEQGERWLSKTCAEFPRFAHRIDRIEERAPTLACPEAARLVLLDPELLASSGSGYRSVWDDSEESRRPLRHYFWPIREYVIGLILNRSYLLWQRMFLLGIFCQGLDAMRRGDDARSFPAFLRDFSVVVASGKLREAMETIPASPALQLELVLQLARLRGSNADGDRRLKECLSAFDAGIGLEPGVAGGGPIAACAAAFARDYEPFFRERPHILENYLANEIFRCIFPFGEAFFDPAATPDFGRAYAQLALKFGMLKGLLIGVAGFYGAAFGEAHVVQTVQTISKHFEHRREFLDEGYALLAEKGFSNIAGLTALLRN